jgi:putative PIN family toxin of toxin-antitoxin system
MPSSSGPARAVVDTNVLVSALLNPAGAPARVLDLILAGVLEPVLSQAVYDEYRDVLARPELALPKARVHALLEFMEDFVLPLPVRLLGVCADPDDDAFLSAALEGAAAWLITGNIRHYPRSPYHGVMIASPPEFLRRLSP